MLFQPNVNRQHSQLAYKVRCFPYVTLTDAGKRLIVWKRRFKMHKARILEACNEDKTKIWITGKEYHIVWAYNNVPTEVEWDKKSPEFIIDVEIRVSPAIPEGAVAILDFQLPSAQHLMFL